MATSNGFFVSFQTVVLTKIYELKRLLIPAFKILEKRRSHNIKQVTRDSHGLLKDREVSQICEIILCGDLSCVEDS